MEAHHGPGGLSRLCARGRPLAGGRSRVVAPWVGAGGWLSTGDVQGSVNALQSPGLIPSRLTVLAAKGSQLSRCRHCPQSKRAVPPPCPKGSLYLMTKWSVQACLVGGITPPARFQSSLKDLPCEFMAIRPPHCPALPFSLPYRCCF